MFWPRSPCTIRDGTIARAVCLIVFVHAHQGFEGLLILVSFVDPVASAFSFRKAELVFEKVGNRVASLRRVRRASSLKEQ